MLASSSQRLQVWPVLAAAALAVPLGVLAVHDPVLGLAATIAMLAAGVVVLDLAAGVCVFILLSYFEALPGLGAVSPAKAVGVLLLVSWAGSVAIGRARARRPRGEGIALGWLLVIFLAWGCASSVWAQDFGRSVDSLTRFGLNFSLFLIVPAAVRTDKQALAVVGTIVAGALLSAVYGLATGINQSTERLSGAGINPNELGLVLIGSIVLSVGMTRALRGRPEARMAASLAVVAGLAAVLLTGSRGALVGLVVAGIVGVAFGGRARAKLVPALLLLAGFMAVYLSLFAAPAVRHRVLDSASGSGRSDLWRVGWRMVEDKPLNGIGLGNFRERSVDYLLAPGAVTEPNFIVEKPKVPHNIYLEVTAELGVIGFLIFVFLLGATLRCAYVAVRRFESNGDERLEALSRALFVAMCGLLAAGAFSSQTYNKTLWTTLALAPALLALSRQRPDLEAVPRA